MKKIVRLTEKDITNMVKRVMNESVIFDELKGYYSKCYRQSPTPTSNRIADEIYDSLTPDSSTFMKIASLGTSTLGTDEVKLIGAFKKLKSFDEFCSTKSSYSKIYNSDMLDDIDGDVDEDEIWKQLSRTVRSLYEKPRTKPVSSVGGGGSKPTTFGVRNQTTGAGAHRSGSSTPTTVGVGGAKKMVKENLSSRTGELYSGINELIDREFDDVEPSEVVRILSNILKHHEGKVYRKKHNINPISKDEVLRNFKRF